MKKEKCFRDFPDDMHERIETGFFVHKNALKYFELNDRKFKNVELGY